jgi:hypothetical protein
VNALSLGKQHEVHRVAAKIEGSFLRNDAQALCVVLAAGPLGIDASVVQGHYSGQPLHLEHYRLGGRGRPHSDLVEVA